jgi:predicted O-methyltransferase YrrM
LKPEELLQEIKKLSNDEIAELIAIILPRCLPSKDNWEDYYYRYFHFWERRGFHITRNHYYSPLPDIYKLRKDLWDKTTDPPNIDFKEPQQLKLLQEFQSEYQQEYESFPIEKTSDPLQFHLIGGRYEGFDAYILYCMIRHLKPKRIIEIGSGISTLLSAQACRKNKEEGVITELIAIEPNPDETLRKGFPGLTKLIPKQVQEVDPKIFAELAPGDFLFIDSTHVLKIESDVKVEYTEILPKLKKGVVIHIHDIFLPAEYPREFIYGLLFFFNEQYLVQAILANSTAFEILWANHFMYLKHFDKMIKAFPAYKKVEKSPKHSSSFWIRKKE